MGSPSRPLPAGVEVTILLPFFENDSKSLLYGEAQPVRVH
jgi:hypothetical protein